MVKPVQFYHFEGNPSFVLNSLIYKHHLMVKKDSIYNIFQERKLVH